MSSSCTYVNGSGGVSTLKSAVVSHSADNMVKIYSNISGLLRVSNDNPLDKFLTQEKFMVILFKNKNENLAILILKSVLNSSTSQES